MTLGQAREIAILRSDPYFTVCKVLNRLIAREAFWNLRVTTYQRELEYMLIMARKRAHGIYYDTLDRFHAG